MPRTSNELTKIMLVACDMSYAADVPQVAFVGASLQQYEDTQNYQISLPFSIPSGYVVDRVFVDTINNTGFKAIAFRGQSDVIIAFAGTDGSNLQDWKENLKFGWNQWTNNSGAIFAYLDGLRAANGVDPFTGGVHFTGQSLGGGLAEYAAYDFLARAGMQTAIDALKTRVTVTTFNGFGGAAILAQERSDFRPDMLANLSGSAAYYIANDVISRLGFNHVGIQEYLLEYRSQTLNLRTGQKYYLDPFDAHRIEPGFYKNYNAVLGFAESTGLGSSKIIIPELQKAAALWAGIFSEKTNAPGDAKWRLPAGVIGGVFIAPTGEVQELSSEVIAAFDRGGAFDVQAGDSWKEIAKRKIYSILAVKAASVALNLSQPGMHKAVAGLFAVALAADANGRAAISDGFKKILGTDLVLGSVSDSELLMQSRVALAAIVDIVDPDVNASEVFSGLTVDIATYTDTIFSGNANWLDETLDYILDAGFQSHQTAEARIEFEAALVSYVQSEQNLLAESADIAFHDKVTAALHGFHNDFTKALANTKTDFSNKYVLAGVSVFGATQFDFVPYDAYHDALKQAATNPEFLGVRPLLTEALDIVESAGQTIQITPGHPQNPFNADGYDPDTAPVPSSEMEEGGGRFFTVFLAYDAPEGGQVIKIKLEGDNVDKFRVLAGEELPVVNGEFTVTIQENTREATFVLINDEDVDSDAAITVSATLIDAQGSATHQMHLEASLALDAQVEANAPTDNLILGDQDPESFEDTLNGTAGNDRILGLSMNDKLSGDAGNDVLEGGDATNILEGGASEDQLFAEDAFDLATLTSYQGYGGEAGTGLRGDWLNGQRGNDSLVGSTGEDVLTGGGGSDLMLGGAGTDRLMGDNDWTAADYEWTHQPVSNPFDELTGLVVINEPYTADGAADILYGGAGDDRMDGQLGDDILYGESGNDVIAGWEGDDVLLGGTGDDKLTGEFYGDLPADVFGSDYLDGEEGNDELYGEGGADVLFGGAGDDRLFGYTDWSIDTTPQYDGADHIEGEGGRDYIHGQTGDDFLDGGADDDTVYGDAGADMVYGGAGNDILFGDNPAISAAENGNDSIDGGDGDDLIISGAGADVLFGGLGADQLQGGSGDDELDGGDDADVLFGDAGDAGPGTQGSDAVEGGAGNDQIVGGGGVDILSGGDGDDQMWGDADEVAAADHAADLISGGLGNDILRGYGGNDQLFGDDGSDTLWGEAGADYLDGGAGDDLLFGDAEATAVPDQGADDLIGGDGNDQLVGYGGADMLDGGTGIDTLFGGEGSDTYAFARGDGQDLVYDEDTTGGIDAVEFAADITPDDVIAARGSFYVNDLVLTINGSSDELTIANQFSTNTAFRMEEIRFADGTVWTPTTTPMLIRGTTTNNVLNGTSGADVFEGLGGNDTLQGGAGNDTYRFFRGDGGDTVTDFDSAVGNLDKVLYAADILPSDVQASRSGNNLVLRLTGTTDQVTVTNYFQNDGATGYSVEQIRFLATGTVWDVNAVKAGVLTGTSGADTIIGYATDDVLTGFGGNDTLTGNAGLDMLDGGPGNDVLQGGTGNDTYRITRGDGQDTITDVDAAVGNVDCVQYAADILSPEVQATRSGNNLVLKLTGTTDQVTVTNYFENDGATSSSVERIEFLADGTFWDVNTVKALALTGTSGNDTITGYATADTLAGLAGNDSLTGNAGNDTLDGGTGNDVMQGGTGNDTYRIARGDGQDTITDSDSTVGNVDQVGYAADILPSDVKAVRSGSNLVLQLTGTTDQVTVSNYFLNDGATPFSVEQIEFLADSTIWDVNTVKSMVIAPTSGDDSITGYGTDDTLNGLGGNDAIRGGGGNDTLDGGAGNDTLYGEGGSDTYLFSRGSGQDMIVNADFDATGTTDVLAFAADILPSQVAATRSGNDLLLTVSGTTDQARLGGYFLGGQYVVEQIKFADGTVWTEQTIAGFFPLNGTAGNDNLQGSGLSEVMNGLAGNDTLRGGGGNDTIDGGLGSDQVYGDDGNDMLIAGNGDSKNANVSNSLRGGNGDDVLIASGNYLDHLYGEAGNDILLGGSNRDSLQDTAGNNLMAGGATSDFIDMGDQNDLVIGGAGDDFIDGDNSNINGIRGRDILAFNKTDGKDPVSRLGAGSTVSIGGGALYSNLSLTTNGVSLTLKVGNNSMAFDWYGQPGFGIPANKAVSVLQIVIEGTRDYNASSTDPMKNKKIQTFDFLGLVAAFDAARAAGQTFNVANNLANYRISGSDTDAIGGAIAYQYARTGTLGTLTYDQMRAVISDPAFAVGAQPITASAAASASASAEPIVTEAPTMGFSLTTDARLVTDGGSTTSGSADAIAAPDVETVSGMGTAPAPGAPDRAEARVIPELLTHGQAASVAVDSRIPPVSAVASGKGIAATPEASTARAPHAAAPAGALDQSAGLVANEANAAGSDTSAGVTAQPHFQHRKVAPDDALEGLAANWFNRRSPNEDLSLLDDIARGEDIVNAPSHGSVVAAWEASHRWLSQYANARKDAGEAAGDGADLSGLSMLGSGSASYDMPRAVVGLRNVSGHQLTSFRGLREGVSVLTQP